VLDNILPQAKDIRDFYERFNGNDELMGVVNRHMSIRKFIKYMDRQRSNLPEHKEHPCNAAWCAPRNYTKGERIKVGYQNLSRDWLDYISWCAELKYNMNDMYVLLPPNFGKAHDRTMKEYQAFKDEQERNRQEKIEELIKEALAAAEGIPAMMMKAKGLMVILPQSGAEIKEEGRRLHHCVGNYVERVAKGETMILFVRKVAEPDIPYFTLEFRDGKVVQCRGKNNCSMTNDVQAFVKAFERKMQGEAKMEDSKKKRKAG
ncbi:MAG: PcfJ domain-containing protein, partial [Acetatifactor sp.]|nr:PcfJ domain-containing protein [Acetatifactor sp.]